MDELFFISNLNFIQKQLGGWTKLYNTNIPNPITEHYFLKIINRAPAH